MQDARPRLAQLVCGWAPARLGVIAAQLAANNAKPAKTFPAYDRYSAYFEPLLLAELAAELLAAAEASESPSSKASSVAAAKAARRLVSVTRAVRSREGDGALVDVIPSGPRSTASPLPVHDGTVVALWDASDSPKGRGIPDSAVMAVVRHPLTRRGGARLYLQFWPGAGTADTDDPEEGEESEASQKDAATPGVPDSRNWALLPLTSMVTMRREHEALLAIKNSPLLSAVLSPSISAPGGAAAITNPELHQQTLSYSGRITRACGLNESQARAVTAAAASSNGFTIVQGPPGTGKTRTILAMLNVIHVDQYQRYYNGVLESVEPPPKPSITTGESAGVENTEQPKLVAGRRLSATFLGGMMGAMDRTLAHKFEGQIGSGGSRELGYSGGGRPKRPRLLVCAPSNAAVDEILTRLITNKFVDGGGNLYSPEIARVGAGDKVSSAARPLTAEGQAEAFLDQFSAGAGDTSKEKARSASNAESQARQRAYLGNWQRMCNSLLTRLERTRKDVENRPAVVALHEELERLYRDLRRLRIAAGGSVESPLSREVRLRKLARTYVEDAQIVFSTLSGAASSILTKAEDDGAGNPGALFDTVIMDEGSQATEPSSLIPLTLGATRCLLVGDPQQLPATVLTSGNAGVAYGQSLLDRLCRCGLNALLLDTQYRMHPAISSFPRRYFYEGRLKDDASVQDEHRSKPYHTDALKPRLGPYAFLDVVEGQERRGGAGEDASIFNPHEAELAVTLYKKLKKDYSADGVFSEKGKTPGSPFGFGVVTPYKRQLRELRQAFDRAGIPFGDVEIDTVDSYQGREKDVIIFSCVRTGERRGIGFVRDVRRMNVGLTRARSSLIVLGSASALTNGSEDWAELVSDADSRGCLVRISRVSRALVVGSDDASPSKQNENVKSVAEAALPVELNGKASLSAAGTPAVRSSRGQRGGARKGKRKRGLENAPAAEETAGWRSESRPEPGHASAVTAVANGSGPTGVRSSAVNGGDVWGFVRGMLQRLPENFFALRGFPNVNSEALTHVLVDYVTKGGILDEDAVLAAAACQSGQQHGQHANVVTGGGDVGNMGDGMNGGMGFGPQGMLQLGGMQGQSGSFVAPGGLGNGLQVSNGGPQMNFGQVNPFQSGIFPQVPGVYRDVSAQGMALSFAPMLPPGMQAGMGMGMAMNGGTAFGDLATSMAMGMGMGNGMHMSNGGQQANFPQGTPFQNGAYIQGPGAGTVEAGYETNEAVHGYEDYSGFPGEGDDVIDTSRVAVRGRGRGRGRGGRGGSTRGGRGGSTRGGRGGRGGGSYSQRGGGAQSRGRGVTKPKRGGRTDTQAEKKASGWEAMF